MRQRQPFRELSGCLIGRAAVEGHHGRRDSRDAGKLSSPPVADGDDFDFVRTSSDGFLKVMHHCCECEGRRDENATEILRGLAARSSETEREARSICPHLA